jgi:hypothetical protein
MAIWELWSLNEAGDQWTMPEMRLSACVGIGSQKDDTLPLEKFLSLVEID